jgi:hypothetical protein
MGVDQWYKSMSRSPPATAVHVRKNFLAAGPHTPNVSCTVARHAEFAPRRDYGPSLNQDHRVGALEVLGALPIGASYREGWWAWRRV